MTKAQRQALPSNALEQRSSALVRGSRGGRGGALDFVVTQRFNRSTKAADDSVNSPHPVLGSESAADFSGRKRKPATPAAPRDRGQNAEASSQGPLEAGKRRAVSADRLNARRRLTQSDARHDRKASRSSFIKTGPAALCSTEEITAQ